MTQNLQDLLALANEAAEISNVDMSETSSGGGGRKLLPAGFAIGTLVEYIELGKHVGTFAGKPKKQADSLFRLGFALTGAAAYLNDDGTPYVFRTFDLSLGNNEKAKAKIAFDRMNYTQTAKHFAQLLGKSFLLEIKVVKGKADPTKERNEINYATIGKPFEAMTGQPYPVPDAASLNFRLFLWDKPTKAGWDSLFIDGVNDKGESKNYLQNMCLKSVDFQGSALEQLIGGGLPDITAPATLAPAALPSTPATPAAPPELPGVNIPQLGAAVIVPQVAVPTELPAITLPTIPALPGVN